MEDSDIQGEINVRERQTNAIRPYMWKKGQSGNPAGRPKGKTMKEYAKELLEHQTEEERQNFLHGLAKEIIWKMAEGNPQNNTELSGKIETTNSLAPEILAEADRLLKEKKLNADTNRN